MGYFHKYHRCLTVGASSSRRVRFRVNFTLISVARSGGFYYSDWTDGRRCAIRRSQGTEVPLVPHSPHPWRSFSQPLSFPYTIDIYLFIWIQRQAMKMLSQRMIHSRACPITGSVHPVPWTFYQFPWRRSERDLGSFKFYLTKNVEYFIYLCKSRVTSICSTFPFCDGLTNVMTYWATVPIALGKSITARNASVLFDVKLQLRIEAKLTPVRNAILLTALEIRLRKRERCGVSREWHDISCRGYCGRVIERYTI